MRPTGMGPRGRYPGRHPRSYAPSHWRPARRGGRSRHAAWTRGQRCWARVRSEKGLPVPEGRGILMCIGISLFKE